MGNRAAASWARNVHLSSVSVIIPSWNAGPFVHEAVQSVLRVGNGEWEVVVVDDGSTDGSVEALATKSWPNVRVVRVVDTPQGPSHARNLGSATARGDVAIFLDADDILLPAARSMVDAVPARDGSACVARWLDTDARLQPTQLSDPIESTDDLLAALFERLTVVCAMAVRRPWPMWHVARRVWEASRWQHDVAAARPEFRVFNDAVAMVRWHDRPGRLSISEDHFDALVCARFWAEEKHRLAATLSDGAALALERRIVDAIYGLVRSGRIEEARSLWPSATPQSVRRLSRRVFDTYRAASWFGVRGLQAHAGAAVIRDRLRNPREPDR